jgi:hypothetical protein
MTSLQMSCFIVFFVDIRFVLSFSSNVSRHFAGHIRSQRHGRSEFHFSYKNFDVTDLVNAVVIFAKFSFILEIRNWHWQIVQVLTCCLSLVKISNVSA